MCSGLVRRARGDRPPPALGAHDAVVIEHGHAVGAEPHVALQAGGAQLEGEFDRAIVFSGAWSRAPRWAKPMGGSSSDGSRSCTTSAWAS